MLQCIRSTSSINLASCIRGHHPEIRKSQAVLLGQILLDQHVPSGRPPRVWHTPQEKVCPYCPFREEHENRMDLVCVKVAGRLTARVQIEGETDRILVKAVGASLKRAAVLLQPSISSIHLPIPPLILFPGIALVSKSNLLY